MKNSILAVKARVIYLIFGLAVVMFICVLSKKDDEFRFRSGLIMSREQRWISYFTGIVVVIVTGYISFKTAKADLILWRRSRPEKSPNSRKCK